MDTQASRHEPAGGPTTTEAPAGVTRRDDQNWAKGISRLRISNVPADAINVNVEGKMVVGPIQGFGQMWQKTYRTCLDGIDATPHDVIREWKAHFPEFWPAGSRFYGPATSLVPGDVALINQTLPARAKLSTGVLVLYADDESFTFMTPAGHVFAGWITFSAYDGSGSTVAQIQVLMRASDPIYELSMLFGIGKQEDRFWQHTLVHLAKHFGLNGVKVETHATCVDSRRQWRKFGNVWHNAGVRTMIHVTTTPLRWTIGLPGRFRTSHG